jgi:aminopeptidase YwaD
MRQSLLILFFLIFYKPAFSQNYIPYYGTIVNNVSAQNIQNNLLEFENLGVKRRGSQALQNTLDWLKSKYTSYGYSNFQIEEFSFQNSNTIGKNLVVTKRGTLYPDKYVIICGHYDTVVGTGTNDNGSGVVTILEIARLLQNIPTEYSIKFINFSGEEDGLIGSRNFVNTVVNATSPKMDIRLVFNIDEVGGRAGMVNNTITCERDNSTPTANNSMSLVKTNELIKCVTLYSPLQTRLATAYASDYMPFQDNGEIITGFFETNESPYPHTANDVLANMDSNYVYNVAKAATGAALHFSVASTSQLDINSQDKNQISLYPIPAKDSFTIDLGNYNFNKITVSIININGKTVYNNNFSNLSQSLQIPIENLVKGIYLVYIDMDNKSIYKKIIKH